MSRKKDIITERLIRPEPYIVLPRFPRGGDQEIRLAVGRCVSFLNATFSSFHRLSRKLSQDDVDAVITYNSRVEERQSEWRIARARKGLRFDLRQLLREPTQKKSMRRP